jgi:hypothetical protein
MPNCCQPVPIRADPRSDPWWAQPGSETPEPIAHDVADRPLCAESDTRPLGMAVAAVTSVGSFRAFRMFLG